MANTVEGKLLACESLTREHRQMETMLSRLGQALSKTDGKAPATTTAVRLEMNVIAAAMNVHFACEEQVLFPAVEPYHPMALMEAEHEELIALRDELILMLQAPVDLRKTPPDNALLTETGQRFISEMLDHIGREDAGIFPTCERALSEAEKAAVIEGMNQLRVEAETDAIQAG